MFILSNPWFVGYATASQSPTLNHLMLLDVSTYILGNLFLIPVYNNFSCMLQIQIHPDQKTLSRFIPKSVLPSNYGGDEKSIECLEGRTISYNKSIKCLSNIIYFNVHSEG